MSRTRSAFSGRWARTAAAGLVLAAGVVASVGSATPAGAQSCGPAPADHVAVAVVVDAGSGSPLLRCVVLPAGSKGADALAAAIGSDQVRVGDGSGGKPAGFVCGLLGVPATGCTSTGTQPTWNYWHAAPGGAWRYSGTGFVDYAVPDRCAIEGWSYGPQYATPRIPPPAVTCQSAPATTAAPRPTTPPAVPAGGSGSTRPPNAAAGAPASASGATTAGPAAASGSPVGAVPGADAMGATSVPPPADPAAAVAGASTVPASTATTVAPPSTTNPGEGREVAATPLDARPGPRSGPGLGLVLGLGAAGALAAVAIARSRRARIAAEQGV